jgi:hypothetical protein
VDIEASLAKIVRSALGAELVSVRHLDADEGEGDEAHKAIGYGDPLLLVVRREGALERYVLHGQTSNEFGHDRRADRAANTLLAYDTFGRVPRHVRAVDVVAARADGTLVSLGDTGELYLITAFAEGEIYASDIRAVAERGESNDRDWRRCDALVETMREIHSVRGDRPAVYRRAIRDLLGHGEGIFGLVDGFPPDVPRAEPARLQALEARCLDFRWKLRGRTHRLRRTHGDFHPFNILIDERDRITLLDASRGCWGDPADDVTALALNYVFFALQAPGSWRRGLGPLWRRFWEGALAGGDHELLEAVPPFLAWRALVMACPRWYPDVTPEARDALLSFVERALAAGVFDPASAEELFR